LRAVWLHPFVTTAVAVVVVALGVFAFWQYVWYQWNMAHADLDQDRPAEARERLAVCLWVWPKNPEVQLFAARAARQSGDLTAAEAHLNACLRLEGKSLERVQLEFLLVRVQSGEVDQLANGLFEAVEAGHPEGPEIVKTVARAYIQRLRYKPASACLTLWTTIEPNNPRPYHWRGWVLERMNNSQAAMSDYLKALELAPDLFEVRLRVVEMLIEDKKAPDAIPHLDLLYKRSPDNPQVQARLGMCRFLEGRTEEARKLMEAAVVHLPTDPALLVSLANLDLQEDRAADAERRLRAVLATDPSDTEALFVLTSVLQALNRPDEATKTLAEFETKRATVDRINDLLVDADKTGTPADFVEIGTSFLSIGRNRFGVYWLERAIEKDPYNQAAHRALTAHYERQGKDDLAAEHRRQIRNPDSKPKSPDGK
jgi:tetratricopeptide (TPR) repeat protein